MNEKIRKITVVKIYISHLDKHGMPLKTKAGVPYKRIALATKEFGQKYISGFITKDDDPKNLIQEGQVLDAIIEEKGDFLNFRLPSSLDILSKRLEEFEDRVSKLELEP